ncbi:hypothetical protein C0J52_06273 [Blattella germanica]|nr:hypothetical protein C0J52_06273 [Blattella germanica]
MGRGGNLENPIIPDVLDVIDCTHIRLCQTTFGDHAESFRNRKNYFSLNVQVILDQGARFWTSLPVGQVANTTAGYCKTPDSIHVSLEENYLANIVERLFGVWKRRFPCLSSGLRNKLETIPNIIVACAVLHNISLQINDNIPEDDPDVIIPPYEPVPVPPAQQIGGLAFRRD